MKPESQVSKARGESARSTAGHWLLCKARTKGKDLSTNAAPEQSRGSSSAGSTPLLLLVCFSSASLPWACSPTCAKSRVPFCGKNPDSCPTEVTTNPVLWSGLCWVCTYAVFAPRTAGCKEESDAKAAELSPGSPRRWVTEWGRGWFLTHRLSRRRGISCPHHQSGSWLRDGS